MPAIYRDDVIAAALPFAKADDRTVLIAALRSSQGATGVDLLRQVLEEPGAGSGTDRGVALHALAGRIGVEGTPLYAEALSDRSVPVQINAMMALAACGDERATPQVVAWLGRKLKRKNRLAAWDPRELPAPITFALRNECLLQIAVVLGQHLHRLHPEERKRLQVVWPGVADGSVGSDSPDPAALDRWLYESSSRPDDDDSEDVVAFRDTYVQAALTRARQRAGRDTRS